LVGVAGRWVARVVDVVDVWVERDHVWVERMVEE
jgi:hypothetical protein